MVRKLMKLCVLTNGGSDALVEQMALNNEEDREGLCVVLERMGQTVGAGTPLPFITKSTDKQRSCLKYYIKRAHIMGSVAITDEDGGRKTVALTARRKESDDFVFAPLDTSPVNTPSPHKQKKSLPVLSSMDRANGSKPKRRKSFMSLAP